jgi:hypothetical protein
MADQPHAVGRRRQQVIRTWLEQDLYTAWRHRLIWSPGMRRWVKRTTHKRDRRLGKKDIIEDRYDG